MMSGCSHVSQAERPDAKLGIIRGWLAGGGHEPAALTGTGNGCVSNLLSWLRIPCAQAEPFSSA